MKKICSGEPVERKSKPLKKVLIIASVVLLILLLVLWGGKRTGLKEKIVHWFDFDVKTMQTANVLEQIQQAAEFTTVCFYDEFVLNYAKENTLSKSEVNKFFKENLNTDLLPKDRLVLICMGKVRAGFDLGKVTADDIYISEDTLRVTLPQAEYFDIILNPSDFEYFERTGNWSHRQEMQVKMQAEKRLRQDAQRKKVLSRAEHIGLLRLEAMYKNFGFSVVQLRVKK